MDEEFDVRSELNEDEEEAGLPEGMEDDEEFDDEEFDDEDEEE